MVALTRRRATWVCVFSALLTARLVVLCAEDVPNPEREEAENGDPKAHQLVSSDGNLPRGANAGPQVDGGEMHEDLPVGGARANQPQNMSLGVGLPEIAEAVASLQPIKGSFTETDVLQLLEKVGIGALQDPATAASNGQLDDKEKNFLDLLAAADPKMVAEISALAKPVQSPQRTAVSDKGAPRAGHEDSTEKAMGEAVDSSRQRTRSRRLQILGLPQLKVPNPFAGLSGVFRSGLSARDRDQLGTFERHVHNSRERVYRDLVFVTGGKQQGIDEFAMKQLVSKVGLENLTSPSLQQSLNPGEAAVLAAARRNRLQVERIIATYEREVALHAKTLKNNLEADFNASGIHSRVAAIASDGLFSKRRPAGLRRLGAVADLLQGPGLLGSAGSLLKAIDPANMSESLSTALGGLGLNHLHLPNLGGLQRDSGGPLLSSLSGNGLQSALEGLFNGPQRAAALTAPLRAFQQGVSTATDGTISAFLSSEGLDQVLDVRHAKQLLGGLIGGETVAPRGATGWHDVGLHREEADQLAKIMPFESFLSKLRTLAHDVDAEVGVLRQDTERRIRNQGVHLLPGEMLNLNKVMDQLVWGTFQMPLRRLQQVDAAMQPEPQALEQQNSEQQQPQLQTVQQERPEQQMPEALKLDQLQQEPQQQQSKQQDLQLQSKQQPAEDTPVLQLEQQHQAASDDEGPDDDLLLELEADDGIDEQQEELELALLKVELLSEAVNVLLGEYEKAVQELQQQLQLQIETANELKLFIEEDKEDWKSQVAAAMPALTKRRLEALSEPQQEEGQQQPKQSPELRIASHEAAEAYDVAMQGMRESVQGFLKRHSELSQAGQQQVEALAAKIEAVAEERLPRLTAAAA